MEQTNPTMEGAEPKGSMGPLIGSIIVIIILVLGAIYFWGGKLNKETVPEASPAAVSASDDISSIETDLENTPDVSADIDNL